jgi:hypothetical protein
VAFSTWVGFFWRTNPNEKLTQLCIGFPRRWRKKWLGRGPTGLANFPFVGLQGARTVVDRRTVELWIKPFTDLGIAIPISLHIHLGIHALEIHFLSLGLQFPSIPYTFWG